MPKRWRVLKQRPNLLEVRYGKADRWDSPDVCYVWGPGTAKADASLMHTMFSGYGWRKDDRTAPVAVEHNGFLKELEARGYDLTTLRFAIQKKAVAPEKEGEKEK